MHIKKLNTYSIAEEIVNISTHGIELDMALAVCTYFLICSCGIDSWLAPLSFALYLFGVISLHLIVRHQIRHH